VNLRTGEPFSAGCPSFRYVKYMHTVSSGITRNYGVYKARMVASYGEDRCEFGIKFATRCVRCAQLVQPVLNSLPDLSGTSAWVEEGDVETRI